MIGERIRLVREACLMTQTDLAQAAGLGQGRVSDLEAGRIDASDVNVDAIARATGYPAAFFYQGYLPDLPEGHYRRRQRSPSKVGRQVRAQVRQLLEVVQRSEQSLRLPSVALEPIRDLANIDAIEAITETVRVQLGVGEQDAIPNLIRAVERAGVVVVRLAAEMDGHDGFSAWPDWSLDGRPIISLSGGHSGDRDRFTVAHELGHLVLHTSRPGVDSKQAELEANRFAGALLLPFAVARRALRQPVTLSVLKQVKAVFGISMAMGARRARDLSLIDPDHYISLMKQLSARGWRRDEPVEVGSEKPLLMPKILEALGGSGTTVERASRLVLPVFALRGLT